MDDSLKQQEAWVASLNEAQMASLIEHLSALRTTQRLERMQSVLQERTRYLSVVLEDIYQPHNAAAVLRSCDGFGVQDVHVIEANKAFRPSDQVAMGAQKWVDTHRWPTASACLQQLRCDGFRIVAGSLRPEAQPLDALPLDRPLAIMVGHEKTGLSESAHEAADCWFTLPMRGFTESYNLSVFTALCLYALTQRLRNTSVPWQLSAAQQQQLQLRWLLRDTPAAADAAAQFANAQGWHAF